MSTAQAPWNRRNEDHAIVINGVDKVEFYNVRTCSAPWPADDIRHAALGDHGAAHAAGAFDDDEPPMAAGAITVPMACAIAAVILWLAIVAWPN